MIKKLVSYVRGVFNTKVLPDNVQLTSQTGPNTMSFNLTVSVDLGMLTEDKMVAINIKQVGITSDGDLARKFIEGVDPKVVKDTMALIALAAGIQASSAPQDLFSRYNRPALEATADDLLPKDPTLLN